MSEQVTFTCPDCSREVTLDLEGRVPQHWDGQHQGCRTWGHYVLIHSDGRPDLTNLRDIARQPRLGSKPDDDTVTRAR